MNRSYVLALTAMSVACSGGGGSGGAMPMGAGMSGGDGELAAVLEGREQVLAELGDEATECERADAWVTWWREEVRGFVYVASLGHAGQPAPPFADLCEAHLTEEQARCVVAGNSDRAIECCLRGTPLYYEHGRSWTEEECDAAQ